MTHDFSWTSALRRSFFIARVPWSIPLACFAWHGHFSYFSTALPPPYRCLVRRLLEGCVLCNSLRLRPAFHCNRLSFKAFGRRRPSSPPFMRGDGPVGPGIRSTYRTPPKISINKYMYIYIGRERERERAAKPLIECV